MEAQQELSESTITLQGHTINNPEEFKLKARRFAITVERSTLTIDALKKYLMTSKMYICMLICQHNGPNFPHLHIYVEYKHPRELSSKRINKLTGGTCHMEICYQKDQYLMYCQALDEKHIELEVTSKVIYSDNITLGKIDPMLKIRKDAENVFINVIGGYKKLMDCIIKTDVIKINCSNKTDAYIIGMEIRDTLSDLFDFGLVNHTFGSAEGERYSSIILINKKVDKEYIEMLVESKLFRAIVIPSYLEIDVEYNLEYAAIIERDNFEIDCQLIKL